MITSFSSPKTKIPLSTKANTPNGNNISMNLSTNRFKTYKDAANNLSIKTPNNINNINSQIENENINPNETLSNIIDAINENNLNTFYEDDNNNFKRNIDQLNLKFYLETEKLVKSSNNNDGICFNSNKLFLILFKQINLYISEIERLNVIILDSKHDPHSISKKLSVINRQKSDFEIKEQIIKTLKFSVSSLEKQLASVLNSENLLRQENKKLQEEKKFYMDFYLRHNNKENNYNNIVKDNINTKIVINNRYNNIKLNNSHSNKKINSSYNYLSKFKTNTSNNNITITNSYNHSSRKDEKTKKNNEKNINKNNGSKSNSKRNNKENDINKKQEIILLVKHRRTYSAQNEEMVNSLNKKIDKLSQGIIKHTNTKTSRLIKQDNKYPTKIINNNINSIVGNYKNNNNNKIIQSVKDGMKQNYLNRKKKNIMNYNHSDANKLELIINKENEASFMKYKSNIYGHSPQYQTTTNGTIKEEENFNYFNKINNCDKCYNINYNSKNNLGKSNDFNNIAELDFMEDLITEVRDYLIENKNKINEKKNNGINDNNNIENKIKYKQCKSLKNSNGNTQNFIKNISFKSRYSVKE